MSSSIRSLLLAALLVCLPAWNAHANSIGFSAPTYSPENGQLSVTVVYDFTDQGIYGGGFDLLYDAGALEFVSFSLSPSLAHDVWFPDFGRVDEPGVVTRLGLYTKFFLGMTSAGEYGTIVFNVLTAPVGDPGCGGFELCLVANPLSPIYSVGGHDVTDELLVGAQARVVYVPVPAALWFLASGLFGLAGLRKAS